MIMTALAPYIIILLAVIFWYTYAYFKKKLPEVKDYIIGTLMLTTFIYKPTIMEFVFKNLLCVN